MNKNAVTVAIYTHPELFPPVLNALDELSNLFSRITVVTRNLTKSHWTYPQAVEIVNSGEFKPIRDSEKETTFWKIKSFMRFTRDFRRTLRNEKPGWVMCNDPISLFSFRLIRPLLGFPVRLWYHNHDVVEMEGLRKYSVGYFAVKSEKSYFRHIELFTFPAEDRLTYFPMQLFRGKMIVVPNYPSIRRMKIDLAPIRNPDAGLKLLYQGHVGEGHGLKEIIDFVKTDPGISLTIVGPGNEDYITARRHQVRELGIGDRVVVLDAVPYSELSKITRAQHVGLAIHEPINILFRTAALASNKIYEYAAAGLPVLYYGDEHYIKYLGKYSWCFPTRLSADELSAILQNIKGNYRELSRAAESDFRERLNFASVFRPVISYLKEKQ